MAKMVNTVLGPVAGDKLGKTLMHEHFSFAYPGWYGDSLHQTDREQLVNQNLGIVAKAKAHGVQTIVDVTNADVGRDVELLKEISERAEINIVCCTGYYYEAEGATAYFKFKQALGTAEEDLYELMMYEVTKGIGKTGVKPGIIKLGTSHNNITPYEEMFFKVSARIMNETEIPLITHTEKGTMGPEQAELLLSQGVKLDRVVIGHANGNTDMNYLKSILAKGAYLGFDRMGIQGLLGMAMEEEVVSNIIELIKSGYEDKIIMSHDWVTWQGKPPVWKAFDDLMKNWHMAHIFEDVIPVLKSSGITDEQINTILVKNPRRILAGE